MDILDLRLSIENLTINHDDTALVVGMKYVHPYKDGHPTSREIETVVLYCQGLGFQFDVKIPFKTLSDNVSIDTLQKAHRNGEAGIKVRLIGAQISPYRMVKNDRAIAGLSIKADNAELIEDDFIIDE